MTALTTMAMPPMVGVPAFFVVRVRERAVVADQLADALAPAAPG